MVCVPAGAGPAQVELAAAGAEHVRHRVEQGAQLRVAIALSLDGLGVEPERDVVDEHPAVDLCQVHGPLATVDERVEGADDVVAVHSKVEREMVAVPAGTHAYGSPCSAASAATIACEPSPPAIASPSAPRSTAPRTSVSRSSPGFNSIGSIPRARASVASEKRSAFPPPERGLKNRTAWRGAGASGRSTWTASVARAAASDTSSPATTSRSTPGAPPPTSSATAPASARPATISPATRTAPRLNTPYHAAAAATTTQANRPKPRGNSLTDTTSASASVAAPTTSATNAASRRLIRSHLRDERQRRIRGHPAAPTRLDRGRRAPRPRDLRRHRPHPTRRSISR